MRNEVDVNVNMLSWAVDRAGIKKKEINEKFPKLTDWINNKKKPTLRQLEDFSKKVHIPFGYLLLDSPPNETIPFPFFRTESKANRPVSVNLYDTILLIQRRQDWLSEYLEENDYDVPSFIGSQKGNNNHYAIVAEIRKHLNIDEQWACAFNKIDEALNFITERIEELGIIVTFNSVVENNNSRPIKVEECRGFVIVNNIVPFMFVNSADGKAAQLFTTIHELAHIWLGESAGFDMDKLLPADSPIEILCDKVAAEFLVPERSFLKLWNERPNIEFLSRHFKVSRIVIARRALDTGKITRAQFFKFYNEYISEIRLKKDNQTGGGDFYAVQKKKLSVRFAAFVDKAVNESRLLYRDAYKLTGLKGDTYQNFIAKTL